MKAPRILALFTILIAGLVFASLHQSARANGGSMDLDLIPSWTTGIFNDWFGNSNIVVRDVNQDGLEEIIGCSGSVFALQTDLNGGYEVFWYGEDIECATVTWGDRDEDGISEIYAATVEHEIVIYDGENFEEFERFTIPESYPYDLITGDVDGDGMQEIVLLNTEQTLVYDAVTFELEWNAAGYGGTSLDTGDIDGDGDTEIVVNDPGNTAYVLDAGQKVFEWGYSGGFGSRFSLGDVDNDNIDEIAFIEEWEDLTVFEGDSMTTKWSLTNLGDLADVYVSDLNGDGFAEVHVGNGQWGSITGYQGTDGQVLWQIPNPDHGVSSIATGDPDNDGINEVIWGAGLSSTGRDVMLIGDWVSETVEYDSIDLDGWLLVDGADIDLDGTVEIVTASFSSNSGYDGGMIRVFDGVTHELEWSVTIATSFYDIHELHIGQLDADPALEILVGGNNWYDTRMNSYDGITHDQEWQSAELGSGPPVEVLVQNIDGDQVEEVFLALSGSNGRVQVLNGASNVIQWDSGVLGYVRDISLGDTDGDGVLELTVLTSSSLLAFDTTEWTQDFNQAVENGSLVGAYSSDSGGAGAFLIYDLDNDKLSALDGITGEVQATKLLPDLELYDILVQDFEQDGDQEIALVGWNLDSDSSYLEIMFMPETSVFWSEHSETGSWGWINSLAAADFDADGDQDLVLGSSTLIQVRDIELNPWPPNEPPIVDAGPDQTVGEGEQVHFTGSFIDPDGAFGTDILWDFGDGSTITGTLTPTHTYGDNGVYNVMLTVTDEEGGIGSDELTVTVENRDPTMEDLPAQSAAVGGFVIFTAEYFDPGFLDSHTASIDWDDGTIEAGTVNANTVSGSHSFTEEGVFSVTVTLTDDDGGVAMQAFTVTVSGYEVYLPIVSR